MTNIIAFQLPAGRAPSIEVDGAAQRWIAIGEGLARFVTATGRGIRHIGRALVQAREAEARYRGYLQLSDAALADLGLTRADVARHAAMAFETPREVEPAKPADAAVKVPARDLAVAA